MKYPNCKKQYIFFYCVMAHVLLHAQDQDLAVFLKTDLILTTTEGAWCSNYGVMLQVFLGRRSEWLSRANESDCGKALDTYGSFFTAFI